MDGDGLKGLDHSASAFAIGRRCMGAMDCNRRDSPAGRQSAESSAWA